MKNIAFVSLFGFHRSIGSSVDRICVGNRIIDGQTCGIRGGSVRGNCGKSQFDVYSGYYFRSVKTRKGIDCLDGICMKDRAMDGSEHVRNSRRSVGNGKANSP